MTPTVATGGASAYGGGGGGGVATTTSVGSGAGGSSANGGGGGGSGGHGFNGANISAQAGGGSTGTSGSGGAASSTPGTDGTAGAFRQGGGGGYGFYNVNYAGVSAASNGAQTVVLARGNPARVYLLVSTDGLSSYTPYYVGAGDPLGNISSILYDGSKYVFIVYTTLRSTTNFTSFTSYSIPSGTLPGNARTTLEYLNGYYFFCADIDLYYSTDLTNWTRANINGGTAVNVGGVAFDGTRYYAVSSAASAAPIYVSTNLTSWTSYNTGATSPGSIAASPTAVVVQTSTSPFGRVSTDFGVTWANIGTVLTGGVWQYSYISATSTWIAGTFTPDVYYTTNPTSTWTLSSDPATAYLYYRAIYNGTRYILPGAYDVSTGTNNVAIAGSITSFTWQTATAFAPTGGAGGNGGIGGGGGGGGGGAFTTTGNGGTGGVGYCRVYSW
jgi:hypothetical protein